MYSQNKEELFITREFKDFQGRFLDIGAYDGKTFSNTLRLVELGWTGVCIEPDSHAFAGLMQVQKDNPQIELVHAALGHTHELRRFYSSLGDAISTTSEAHVEKWRSVGHFQQIHVATVTIMDIFRCFGNHYDFVNLDVESTNWQLLQELPLREMGTTVLCVEHDNHIKEITAFCASHGLRRLVHSNHENLILAK